MTASTDPSRQTNRLIHETSPYLLQHAHNPVDWYPWGAEALARAKAENRPILLSIGYSACHWCHVMERESFEDEAVASPHEPALREHQGGPRRAARPGRHLHGRHAGAEPRTGRLAHDGVPHPGSAAVLRGDLLPPAGRIRAARLLDPPHPDRRSVGSAAARPRPAGGDAHRAPPRAGRVRPGWKRRRGGDTCRRAGTGRRVRPDLRGIRARAQVPPGRADLASPPTPPADRRRCRPGHGDQDPGWHGPGRDVRPDRRRLCPLLHG